MAVSLTGCGQDAAVEDVASFSANVLPRFKAITPQLAYDIKTACRRLQAVRLATDTGGKSDDKHPGTTIDADNCTSENQDKAISAFTASNDLIANYLSTIGKLAGAKTASMQTETAAVVDAIGKLPVVSQPEVNQAVGAAGAITTILIRAATKGYQKAQLRSVMTSADVPLREFSKAYTNSFRTYYTQGILADERIAVNAFYGLPVQLLRRPTINPLLLTLKPLITPMLTKTLWAEQEAVENRVEAAQTYTRLIQQISCDHTRLVRLLHHQTVASASATDSWCDQNAIAQLPPALQLMAQPALARHYAKSSLDKYDKMLAKIENMSGLITRKN